MLKLSDDEMDAILRAEDRPAQACEVFNIGSGASHSVAEIIAAAQAVAGTSLPVVSRESRRNPLRGRAQ